MDQESKLWGDSQITLSAKKGLEVVSAEVQAVVDRFSLVFSELEGLHPVRFNDHHIPIKEGAQPFKLRPYRCPYIQKT